MELIRWANPGVSFVRLLEGEQSSEQSWDADVMKSERLVLLRAAKVFSAYDEHQGDLNSLPT